MISLLLALAVSAAPAPAPPTVDVAAEKMKLLVLDFRDDGVGERVVRVVQTTLVSHLGKDERIEVISADEMRRTIDMAAEKTSLGCDDDSCLAEIAEGMGARLTMYGTVGKLGDLVIVNVGLYDAAGGVTVARETIEVRSLDALPAPLRAAGDRVLAKLPGLGPVAATSTFPGPLFITGSVVTGLGLVASVTGIAGWLINGNTLAASSTADFAERSALKFNQDAFGLTAVGGFAGLVVGGGLLIAGALTE